MIRLFITDLDNTLFNEEKKVNDVDRKALHRLSEEGVSICLASGRMDKELVQVMRDVGGSFHRISQNGAFIYMAEGECLLSAQFEGDLAKRLYEAAEPYDLAAFFSIEDRMFVPQITDRIQAIEHRMFFPVEPMPNLLHEIGKTIFPSKICLIGDIEKIKRLDREIHAAFPGQVDTYISDKDILDFMPANISKGAAVLRLIDRLGISPEEVATIGDSYNDISMLKVTPYSFAMAHAVDDVRKEAARTVKSVAEAIDWVLHHNRENASLT